MYASGFLHVCFQIRWYIWISMSVSPAWLSLRKESLMVSILSLHLMLLFHPMSWSDKGIKSNGYADLTSFSHRWVKTMIWFWERFLRIVSLNIWCDTDYIFHWPGPVFAQEKMWLGKNFLPTTLSEIRLHSCWFMWPDKSFDIRLGRHHGLMARRYFPVVEIESSSLSGVVSSILDFHFCLWVRKRCIWLILRRCNQCWYLFVNSWIFF